MRGFFNSIDLFDKILYFLCSWIFQEEFFYRGMEEFLDEEIVTNSCSSSAFFCGVIPVAVTAQEAGPDWTGTVTINRDRQFNRAVTEI